MINRKLKKERELVLAGNFGDRERYYKFGCDDSHVDLGNDDRPLWTLLQ